MKLSHKLTYTSLKTLSVIIGILPQWLRNIFSKFLYLIFYYLIPIRKRQVFKNIKFAFPNMPNEWYTKTVKNSYSFFLYNFIQFFAFPKSYFNSKIEIIGEDILKATLKQEKGVVFVSGHFGVWEILGAWICQNKYPLTTVAMKQRNRGSDKFFKEHRAQLGMRQMYRKSSLDNMYKILQQKEIIGLVSDQDAKKRGVFVNFFNQKTSTPKGAARFHLESGAPIIFTLCYQNEPNNFIIEFHQIEIPNKATIESITQSYTSLLEIFIRQFPEQYFWFHRRWRTKPDIKS